MTANLHYERYGIYKGEKGIWFSGHEYRKTRIRRKFLSCAEMESLRQEASNMGVTPVQWPVDVRVKGIHTTLVSQISAHEMKKASDEFKKRAEKLCAAFDLAAPVAETMKLQAIYNKASPLCVFSDGHKIETLDIDAMLDRLSGRAHTFDESNMVDWLSRKSKVSPQGYDDGELIKALNKAIDFAEGDIVHKDHGYITTTLPNNGPYLPLGYQPNA